MTQSRRPVIVLPNGAGPDGYASAFALVLAASRLEKTIDIVAEEPTPSLLAFLSPPVVRPRFGALRKFVVDVDTSKTSLGELSYDLHGDTLSIYLTPKQGAWSEADVTTRTGTYKYDLILVLGASELDALGQLFLEHTDFFYRTPIINIDHTPANEQFGQVNLVDVTASSVGEVVLTLILSNKDVELDEEMSTLLMTGMIAKTKSFKTPNVTPTTLSRASQLVKHGARRAEIVDNLYRTRSVETLRLWGRALARLKKDTSVKLVWSLLTQQDFAMAGASEEALPDVIEELIHNAPEAQVVALLYEDREKHVCGLISAIKPFDSLALAAVLKPVGTRQLARVCFTDKSLPQAEAHVIKTLAERIKIHRETS
ncbi:hypothetical protein A3C17_00440 [Candidatus Uhrbacteria bacterium RIFCSPHIGHO2_02_FULL_53_13]|uniref:DDH domain-containing protein n=2 Tax=Candidatus Uhriibacteriota TaxID=1752732 RepID=A0A1F7TYI7_9BACT|nr:MAG: hypothetical protein A3C17_00440 [Candidatus Uhrbacteria bacterium RIFCSPHIGHO2_02_FULL_53_13]OGL88769.1 MAG: hypothetical protein A3I45_04330 [Candidatus Uhrbacteria bacterium RIFCSPLOWO2_02_FULL_53_10]